MSLVVNELTDTCKILLKEKCQKIAKVYEYCQHTDFETNLKCSKILYDICVLLSGDENYLEDTQRSIYAAHYITNNEILTSHLVQIIADAEDIRLCSCAIEIIHTLLLPSGGSVQEDIKIFKRNLNCPTNFSQLLQCVYKLNTKFCAVQCKEILLELQIKLLHILSTIYETKTCRDVYRNASADTVSFLGKLLSSSCNNSKLFYYLLPILNIVCHTKKNCEILSCQSFFDALSNSCKLTKRLLTVISILKTMSRNEVTLNCLASNANSFKLLLDFLNYSGKKHMSKRTIINILYRITKTEQGLELLKIHEHYQHLLDCIIKCQNLDKHQNRMTVIKAYTILNRTITKLSINPKPTMNSGEYFHVKDDGSSSEDSDGENDDSDGENNDSTEDSNDLQESDAELIGETPQISFSKQHRYLPNMKIFFGELFNSKTTSKLNIFENVDQDVQEGISWQDVLKQRVHRDEFYDKHSYPDCEVLEEQSDEHYLNSNTNNFNLEQLVRNFKYEKGLENHNFTPRIVYDFNSDYSKNCNNITLHFDSHFECGNLNSVIQTNDLEYELVLTPDTGSYRGLQWFYFQITNIRSGLRYTLNIINFLKVNSQYNFGMQPLSFSVREYMLNGIGWKRAGENIVYFGNNYTNHSGTRQYRTLSFTISFKYTDDCVYFAYHYPYTYTRLLTLLYPIYSEHSNIVYKRVDKLCNTVYNNEVPLLTITAAFNNSKAARIPINERPIIFITARVHPGETNSSWIAEGMINFLLNEENEEASKIREHFIFKIIPMLNIEGVVYGNTRSGITGSDLNRCWANPKQNSCSEIYYTKKLIEYVRKGLKKDIAACIDIHGHSRKKYFFFYGCNPKMSWNQEDWQQGDCLEALKVLPLLTSTLNPHIRLNFCRYRIERNRESTARVVMWREFGIQNSYTLECSYCSGDNQQIINTKILTGIGANVIAALGMMKESMVKSTSKD